MTRGVARLPAARAGAPPVRGKGACSHLFGFGNSTNLHSGPGQADSGRYTSTPRCTEGRSIPRAITSATSLDNLRKEAKRWLKDLREKDPAARARFDQAYPQGPADPVLRDVQHALAREYGQAGWIALKREVEAVHARSASTAPTTTETFETLVNDLMLAFNERDAAALQRFNAAYRRTFTVEDLGSEIWRRLYSFRQRAFANRNENLQLEEAQTLIAQNAGFPSWASLISPPSTRQSPVP